MVDEIVFLDSEIIIDDDGSDVPVGTLVNIGGKSKNAKADEKVPTAADVSDKAHAKTVSSDKQPAKTEA
ncbi:MAG: hypothetical protein K2M36_01420, partial [Clostridia bacterium]|nr:hypothetical protein [Clostridia bacterium]